MSYVPKFFDLVHANDEHLGRAPKPAPSKSHERFYFGMAALTAAITIVGALIYDDVRLLRGLWTVPTLSFGVGMFLRIRRLRMTRIEASFYFKENVSNG
ncbi:hypothetical protein [Sphingopyxis sp.]|uniref:hypothetical protein n=1 Tax=Sphingopyxis sp. TaxID=1908224 RepID=UPI002ED8DE0B